MDYGITWPMETPIVFQRPLAVLLHSPNAGNLPAVRAAQGDREIVYRAVSWNQDNPGHGN